jgi:hypothetical protein
MRLKKRPGGEEKQRETPKNLYHRGHEGSQKKT